MFAIESDSLCRNMLALRLSGLWDMEECQRFERQLTAHVERLGGPSGGHLVIIDLSDFKIQSQAVVQACLGMVSRGLVGCRTAFIVGEGLARIQIKRVNDGRTVFGEFQDVIEARRWLLSNEGPVRIARS